MANISKSAHQQQNGNGPPLSSPPFNASEHFFEGAEKLLEVWFENSGQQQQKSKSSLRKIPESELIRMLDMAGCHILQVLRTEEIDAYLLR